MNLYIYSDESGVFDKIHNDIYVYGGLICFSKNEVDSLICQYKQMEQYIRVSEHIKTDELKAVRISNKSKAKLYRWLNKVYKFGAVINEHKVMNRIFENKKSKQRYLDYAYKITIRKQLENLISLKIINPDEIENVCFFIDEHSTATNGRYELRESLAQELLHGTYNWNYSKFYEPILPKNANLHLTFCDSNKKPLIRAADIIANRIFYYANHKNTNELLNDHLFIHNLP